MLRAALTYAATGWHVFPCRYRAKEPLTTHGFQDATTEAGTIRAWWQRWPQANIGLATGRGSGVVVLDVDPRHGGDDALLYLPSFPATVECLTGGGGRHIYFEAPAFEVRCSNNALGPGLDVKGDGGYVLLPPSVHPTGRAYQWEVSSDPAEVEIAPMPGWLLGSIRHSSPQFGALAAPSMHLPVGRRTLDFIAAGAPIGDQRLRAVAAARNLLSAGYTVESAAEAIWCGLRASAWDPDREPWSEDDALRIVADLASKPAPAPRPLERAATVRRTWAAEVPA